MRNNVVKLLVGVGITAIGMFAADSAHGTWKYNAAKSKTNGANPPKSQTDVREATPDGGTKLTRTGQLTDGTAINYSFTYKFGGKEYPVTGAPFDVVSARRIDANTMSFEAKKTDGKYHVIGQNVVSKDGKTLTQTGKGTDSQGKPLTSTAVFDRQ